MPEPERWTETVDPLGPPELRLAAVRPFRAGELVDRRYEIIALIGSGGSSLVYRARDLRLGSEIALKVLRSDRATESALKRFRREVAIARESHDARVVRVHDIGESDGVAYISMELVRGESLRGRIAHGPLAIEECIRLGRDILTALGSLHELGIIHRDLKPSNILLTESGEVRLADFGLARHVEGDESRATQTDAIVGTLEYLAPEQLLGGPLDHRSDLYAFGVVLYECLTGRVPFPSTSHIGAALAHIRQQPPGVRVIRPEAPRWLARLVARLLEKAPASRYQSVKDAMRDLELRRTRVRVRRRTVALALALLLCGGGAIAVSEIARPRFHHLVRDGSAVRAVDGRGRPLWRIEDTDLTHAALVRRDGSPAIVAAFLQADRDRSKVNTRLLRLLDPDTGRVLKRMRLPEFSQDFPGFSDSFFPGALSSIDWNGDGREELVASYFHTYWPSYSVFIDPETLEAKLLLLAGGHHRFAGGFDLDGDGRKEMLFLGIANRLGWYGGVAAVSIEPVPRRGDPMTWSSALTPDLAPISERGRGLLWYALVPQAHLNPSSSSLEFREGVIRVRYPNDREILLDREGFLVGSDGAPGADRRAERAQAYEAIREAGRLSRAGRFENALAPAAEAVEAAGRAGDVFLTELARRRYATALIRSGRSADGARIFELIAATTEGPQDVAFDAANALHLSGALDEAMEWYWRGLTGDSDRGRLKPEFIEGIVVARIEKGEFAEAAEDIGRMAALYPELVPALAILRVMNDWLSGSTDLEILPLFSGDIDFQRLMHYEARNVRGEEPSVLLPLVEENLGEMSGAYRPLLLSLKGDLLRRTGDRQGALAVLREAAANAASLKTSSVEVRIFGPVIRRRLERAEAEAMADRRLDRAATATSATAPSGG